MPSEMQQLLNELPNVRLQFERKIEKAAKKSIKIAKEISPAIGEVSISEARETIVREFIKEIMSV